MKKRNLSLPLAESNIPDSSGDRNNRYNPTDPPNKSKRAKVMGLPGQQVYTEAVPKRHQDFSDPNKYSEQYHHRGDVVAPSYNKHTETGVRRKGHGQVTRPVDPSKSPYTKNVVKGSKGVRRKG